MSKQEAVKGFKVVKLPKVMMIQLNRFTIDYLSPNFSRIKINDRVTFPLFLNMSPFMHPVSEQDLSNIES